VFERYTDRARRVIVLCREEARLLNHDRIGTHEMFLGLLAEEQSVAARALNALGITLDKGRAAVEELVGRGETEPLGHIPFVPNAKRGMEMSLREALTLGHNYIAPEHILLGLIRDPDDDMANLLKKLNTNGEIVRKKTIDTLITEQNQQKREKEEKKRASALEFGVIPVKVEAYAVPFLDRELDRCRPFAADDEMNVGEWIRQVVLDEVARRELGGWPA
jgi:ATP-dependent Clp protease ATP-binding subunit ClpA